MLLIAQGLTLQSRAAPRAFYILPLVCYHSIYCSGNLKAPAFTQRPKCVAHLSLKLIGDEELLNPSLGRGAAGSVLAGRGLLRITYTASLNPSLPSPRRDEDFAVASNRYCLKRARSFDGTRPGVGLYAMAGIAINRPFGYFGAMPNCDSNHSHHKETINW
jgi:hypothetical protein